ESRIVDAYVTQQSRTANAPIKSDANKEETDKHRDTRPYQSALSHRDLWKLAEDRSTLTAAGA
ncbi:MAG TPA: hypothetical protein VG099_07750, partial [Gemmataceae bacterium]|nr:hypothetical protein [Gemmataceae bacterium]